MVKCNCQSLEQFKKTFESRIPFKEIQYEGNIIRMFPSDTEPHLLKWHRDEEDRLVTPIGENDWKFQFDNELPQNINKSIYIPKGIFHRLIKGTTDLFIKIEKYANSTRI